MSAVGDTAPVLTVDLGTYKDVSQVDVYSGYGYPKALVSTAVTSAAIDQIRLTMTDPSSTTPDIARVYEVAAP